MAHRNSYWGKIAESIAAIVEDRQIERVLHFTRLANLPRILEHGLLTRSGVNNADFDVYARDAPRPDGENNAVSVSISCYHPRMFWKKRDCAGNKPWAILFLHPGLLGNYRCHFFSQSAISNDTKYESGQRYGGFALEKLFKDWPLPMDSKKGFRDEHGLPPGWPTYPDSEVQVMSPIHPDYIMGAWVETDKHGEFVRATFKEAGREECEMVVRPFEPRISRKPYYWG